MNLRRRDFLKLGLSQSLALGMNRTPSFDSEKIDRKKTPSIVQGPTDDCRTQFSIVHEARCELDFLILDSQDLALRPDRVLRFCPANQSQGVTQIFLSSLHPGEDYRLILLDAQTGESVDQRLFRTLDLDSSNLEFALCSCMDDALHEPLIWRDLVAKRPDVIFFIGDSTYADSELGGLLHANPEMLWRRFAEARSTLEIYFSERLIPIFSVWDDHDFGGNDLDSKSYPYVRESQENFAIFFPRDPDYCRFLIRGPGISLALQIRDHLIFLLDDRSFRLRKGSQDRYAQWGKEQEEWMLDLIRVHPGPCWIMNGSQIFAAMYFKESVSGDHPLQLAGLISQLKKTGRKILFASGDVHFSEISRIEAAQLGYETFEITSSSMHSIRFPGAPHVIPNFRRVAGTGRRNYVLIKSEAKSGTVIVESRSAGNEVNFRRKIKI